jgi:hypothetical protein
MLLSIISASNIRNVKNTRVILVHNLESADGKIFSELVHFTTNTSQELLVINSATVVSVKDLAYSTQLLVSETHSQVVHCFFCLCMIKLAVSVVIENLKKTTETHNATSTSGN